MGEPSQLDTRLKTIRDRLFAIDMLSGRDCGFHSRCALRRDLGIEIDRCIAIGKSLAEICGPECEAMFIRERPQARLVSANQNRFRQNSFTVTQSDAALLAESNDRACEMLCAPHSPGHTVHDDFNGSRLHGRKRLDHILYMIYEIPVQAVFNPFSSIP